MKTQILETADIVFIYATLAKQEIKYIGLVLQTDKKTGAARICWNSPHDITTWTREHIQKSYESKLCLFIKENE